LNIGVLLYGYAMKVSVRHIHKKTKTNLSCHKDKIVSNSNKKKRQNS
jgi:hypothetical protein